MKGVSVVQSRVQLILFLLPGIVTLGILLCLPLCLNDFALLVITQWLIYGLLALSLTLIWGVGGIFSFGQTAFWGLAGYAYALISLNFAGWLGTCLGLLGGVAIALLVSLVLGYFMFYGRANNLSVGIITLSCSLICYDLFNSLAEDQYRVGQVAIGGFNGIQRVPTLFNLEIGPHYCFVLIAATLVLGGLMGLRTVQFGRVFNAVRLNEARTELLGYDVRAIKLIGFAIGGAIAGFAGVLQASWGNTVSPTFFNIEQTLLVIILVLVGGRRQLWGAFLGAALIQALSGFLGTVAEQFTPLILGIVLVAIVLLLPSGIAPALQKLWRWRWPFCPQLSSPAGDRRAGKTNPVAPSSGSLQVQGLKHRFGNLQALNGLNLKFSAGQAYSIIGPNGAGKSTFFNLLTGQLKVAEGRIFYAGKEITRLLPHQRARQGISIKLQLPNVYLELSVYENLWLAAAASGGNAAERQWQIAQMLDQIGLRDRLLQPAGKLSHGEKQWLEVGMAAVAQPTLLLLDEPTAGMSRGETLRTVALIKQLVQRSTVIVVEHDMEFVRQLDATVIVLAQGQVFLEGTVAAIQQNQRVREIYLGSSPKP